MTDERSGNTVVDVSAEDQAQFFDPDVSSIADPTTQRIIQLVEEMNRLRASARHWKARASKAEPMASRAEDLQKRLNEKLSEESAARLNGNAGKTKSEAPA